MWTLDWDRLERRLSVNELQLYLIDQKREMRTKRMHFAGVFGVLENIKKWIDEGRQKCVRYDKERETLLLLDYFYTIKNCITLKEISNFLVPRKDTIKMTFLLVRYAS